jgi:prevent-host-death family protein
MLTSRQTGRSFRQDLLYPGDRLVDRLLGVRTWQLQEARSRSSELVSAAVASGPQRVTRHGKAAVIVVSEADWEKVIRKIPSFGRLLAQCPLEPEDLAERRRRGRCAGELAE